MTAVIFCDSPTCLCKLGATSDYSRGDLIVHHGFVRGALPAGLQKQIHPMVFRLLRSVPKQVIDVAARLLWKPVFADGYVEVDVCFFLSGQ